ncbi:MAG: hypothetical protein RLZZ488_2753 [Pseudomonadota bacterium]
MNVLIRKNNGMILGPIAIGDLASLLASGQIHKGDKAALEGSNDWQEVTTLLKQSGLSGHTLAGHGRRLIAFLFDLGILFMIVNFSNLLFEKFPLFSETQLDTQRQFIFYTVIWQIVIALLQASRLQASLGKAIVGLAVLSEENQRLTLSQSFARQFAFIATASFLIFFLMPLFSRKRQAAHDVMIRSVVVEV